jgi:hypothetical protein
MAEAILLDNDVILKAAQYQLDAELAELTTFEDIPPSVLTVARFVIQGRIQKLRDASLKDAVSACFARLLTRVQAIEPTEDEVQLAAEFETCAQRAGLDLDGGESQLLAILLTRNLRLLVTGDKRAIVAIECISKYTPSIGARIGCFEQLIASIVTPDNKLKVRTDVCKVPYVDKAISICFACSSEDADHGVIRAALSSYIQHVRGNAPNVLISTNDLSAAIF